MIKQAFGMNAKGDFEMTSTGEFNLIEDIDVDAHSLWLVLSTQRGEWRFNPSDGIVYKNMLRKYQDEKIARDRVRVEMMRGLRQVDPVAYIQNMTIEIQSRRNAIVNFTAVMSGGELLEGGQNFA